jgi:hypothetical protein
MVRAGIEDGRPAIRARLVIDREHADAPIALDLLDEALAGRVERYQRTIATDAPGRVCIELYDGLDSRG